MDPTKPLFSSTSVRAKRPASGQQENYLVWNLVAAEPAVLAADSDGRMFHIEEIRCFFRVGGRAKVTFGGHAVSYQLADGPLLEFVATRGTSVPVLQPVERLGAILARIRLEPAAMDLDGATVNVDAALLSFLATAITYPATGWLR